MQLFDTLARWAQRVKQDGLMLWFACKHPQTPWLAKAIAAVAVAYALSPIDLIPDFIPVLGYLDEALLLPALKSIGDQIGVDLSGSIDAASGKSSSGGDKT